MSKLFLLLFLFFSVTGYAQVLYKADDIAPALKDKANAVLRDMETTVDMRTANNVVQTVKKVITVLNKNGEDRAQLALFYNKNIAIKRIKGAVYDTFGTQISKFTESNFTDESAISDFSLFEDDRVKHFSPNVVSYPYTVVYEYEVRNKQNLILPDWDANPYPDVAVEKNSYTFICKPEDQLRIKEYNYKGQRTEQKTKDQLVYSWSAENISAFQREPFSPDPEQYLTSVKIAAENFVYYNAKGTYSNWEELGKWTYTNLIQPKQELSPETVASIKELVKDVQGDKNKAKKIYEYMQHKTRYISVQIGIGGYQPMNASEVDRLGYGDCKGLVNYMQSLLKAAGIPSYYCIVYAGDFKKSLDPEYASMNQANHIVLCLPFEKDTTWLECTNQEYPFGFLGDFTDDRIVLACTPEGGKLMRTPVLSASMNLVKRSVDLTLDKEGSLHGIMNTTFTGSKYDTYEYLIRQTKTEQLKLLKRQYDIDNINFNTIKFSQQKGLNPATSEALDLTIDRYAPATNSRIYLLVNAFNRMNTIPEGKKHRILPVYINRGYTEEDELTYHLPDGYVAEAKPVDAEIKSPFGVYTAHVRIEPKKLVYTRKFVLNNGTYSADQYEQLVKFIDSANTSDYGKIVFKNN